MDEKTRKLVEAVQAQIKAKTQAQYKAMEQAKYIQNDWAAPDSKAQGTRPFLRVSAWTGSLTPPLDGKGMPLNCSSGSSKTWFTWPAPKPDFYKRKHFQKLPPYEPEMTVHRIEGPAIIAWGTWWLFKPDGEPGEKVSEIYCRKDVQTEEK